MVATTEDCAAALRQPYPQYRRMQTEIAVKKYFLWGENNRSKLSRFRNKFIQWARANVNEGTITDIMTEMELVTLRLSRSITFANGSTNSPVFRALRWHLVVLRQHRSQFGSGTFEDIPGTIFIARDRQHRESLFASIPNKIHVRPLGYLDVKIDPLPVDSVDTTL
jgi:hypothetical protein